jgi:uncharacterized protein
MDREFQIFVKPAGSACNLRCSYCYYNSKEYLYSAGGYFIMSDEILEEYIKQHIEATTDKLIMFSWHGGEPTMAGIGFFKKAVDIQKKYLPAGKKIINGIQTNGTLLDDDFCRFMASECFIAGISIDGPAELHNIHRMDTGKKGTFERVLKGYKHLRMHGVTTEILCVVGSHNADDPLKVYDFFKLLEAEYITFLPLVNRKEDSSTGVTSDSVTALAFGNFLISVFDEWVEKDIGQVKIQLFEEVARTAFNQEHTLCIFKTTCGGVPVVEYNGDFYSCDHFVNSKHYLGNISELSLSELLDSTRQKAFGEAKLLTLPRYCRECEVRNMCNGGCPKNRFINTPDGESGLNYLCEGYKRFFTHCRPFVEAIRITRLTSNQ